MAALLTLEDAKQHLRITDTDHDVDVQVALDAAEGIILDYLKVPIPSVWTAASVPPSVTAAIRLMLAELYEHRGDDLTNNERLWNGIAALLMRLRDPALA